jgi:hypothetical protein
VTDIASILGRQRVLARIGRALQSITAALPDDNPQKALEEQKALERAADSGAGD